MILIERIDSKDVSTPKQKAANDRLHLYHVVLL